MLKVKRYTYLCTVLTLVFGLITIFVGGMLADETRMEKIAEYATTIVKNKTKAGKYCAITVQKTETSGQIIDYQSEFHSLYGTFRQTKATFASTMNADKDREIVILDSGMRAISNNLSVLYVGPVGTIEYNNHYKHYIMPIEVMFEDERMYDINNYIAYISQEHANALLESCGANSSGDSYTESDYRRLLKTIIHISIDGESYEFVIQNIYYNQNYYYEGLNDIMGDFIMASYFMPANLRDEQQNVYFMSEYDYQNKYFMEYINKAYPSKKYSVKVNHYNLKEEINDDYLLSFYYGSKNANLDWISAVIMVLSITLVIFSLLLFARGNNKNKAINHIVLSLCLFIPYGVFYLLYTLTNNVAFLSRSATRMYTIISMIYLASYLIILLIKNRCIIRKISICKEEIKNENVDI